MDPDLADECMCPDGGNSENLIKLPLKLAFNG